MTDTAPTAAAAAEELRTIVGRLVRRMRASYTFPAHQFSALTTLERSGALTTSQLATLEHVRPQSMAHTLQQLDTAGFIVKRPDASDGRQTLVDLSDLGRAAVEEQRRESSGWLSTAVEDALDGDERATLIEAIALMNRLMDH